MSSLNNIWSDSRKIAYMVYSFILGILLYRFLSGAMIHHLGNVAMIYPSVDNTYWLFHITGIPELMRSNNSFAWMFDIILVAIVLGSLLTAGKIRGLSILTSLFILTYMLLSNSFMNHHYHALAGAFFITVPFWFKKEQLFSLALEGVRYYYFFIFSSAALWKIIRGAAFHDGHLSNILKSEHSSFLLNEGSTLQTELIQELISNPSISDLLMISLVFIQLSFLIGFFTKKLDRVFILVSILFMIANYTVMRIFSAELLIFCIALLPWRTYQLNK